MLEDGLQEKVRQRKFEKNAYYIPNFSPPPPWKDCDQSIMDNEIK